MVVWIHPSLFDVIARSCSDCWFRGTPGVTCDGRLVLVVRSVHFEPGSVHTDPPGIRFVDVRLFATFSCGQGSCRVGLRVAVVQVVETPSERCCCTELPGVHNYRL